jgi:hypothetical protein
VPDCYMDELCDAIECARRIWRPDESCANTKKSGGPPARLSGVGGGTVRLILLLLAFALAAGLFVAVRHLP